VGYGRFAVSLGLGKMGLGEMVMMFAATDGDVVRGGCGCGCVGAGGFVAIWIRCGWVCVAVGLGLGEMVMMFAATGGDVVRGGCGCGRLVLPWVWEGGVAVDWLYGWSVEKIYIKKNYLIIF
jgi:hypothetical protein